MNCLSVFDHFVKLAPKGLISITFSIDAETIVQRCSVKKVLLKISQNSQGNTCFLKHPKFLRATFIKEHLWWMPLDMHLLYRFLEDR